MELTRKPQNDFSKAVRPALFFSVVAEQEYLSSHGGCVTVGHFEGRPIGITCRHVIADYQFHQLRVTESLWGEVARGANGFLEVIGHRGDTSGTEIEDLVVCVWDDPQPNFVIDEIIDFNKIVDSEQSDSLIMTGFLKEESNFYEQPAKAFGLEVSITDIGQLGVDKFLRTAGGLCDGDFGFDSLAGFSGGLVYNTTKSGPTGIMVRGGIKDGRVRIHFVSLSSVFEALRRTLPEIENRMAPPPSGHRA